MVVLELGLELKVSHSQGLTLERLDLFKDLVPTFESLELLEWMCRDIPMS